MKILMVNIYYLLVFSNVLNIVAKIMCMVKQTKHSGTIATLKIERCTDRLNVFVLII